MPKKSHFIGGKYKVQATIADTEISATADFEVQTADTTAVSPKTGDNDQAALWITLLLLSCGALTAVGIRKKKK